MSDPNETRITELERRLALYERMAEELSAVLAEQDKRIDILTRQVRRLTGRLLDLEAGWEPSPQDEKPPPHY